MTIETLHAERRDVRNQAIKLSKKITANTPENVARKIEAEFNGKLLRYDELTDRIEEARSDFLINEPVKGPDARAPGVDGGESEQPEDRITGLKPEQRFSDWASNEYANDALTYRDLTPGAFLRSMILGARTDLERRALAEGTDSAGGQTTPTILSAQLIDLMRAQSVASRAGATTVPLTTDNHVIAKLASDPVPAWRGENASIAESDPTFAPVNLKPKSMAVMVKISRELLEDSLNLETELPRILAAALAQEWDRVALIGSGTAPEPEGVANVTGIGTAAHDAALTNYAPFVSARTALLTANHQPTAIIMHPRDEGTMTGLTATDNQPLMPPRQIETLPMLTTTQIPVDGGAGNDESTVFMGDFSRLMLGVRTQIRIEVLRELFAENHQYGFVAHMRGDIAVSHPLAFHTTTGVQG